MVMVSLQLLHVQPVLTTDVWRHHLTVFVLSRAAETYSSELVIFEVKYKIYINIC